MRKESTTTFLRRGFISTLALCAALLTSCSGDTDLFNNEPANANDDNGLTPKGEVGLVAEARSKRFDIEATRSSFEYNASKGMLFKWDANDKLTVFAEDNYQAKQIYNIKSKAEYDNRAHFSSQDFKLTEGKRYFALSKAEGDRPGGSQTSIPDQKNIIIDYSGQKQDGNGNTAHLGKYDFMAASAVCEEEDQLHFDFPHLGATLRIKIKSDDVNYATTKFSKLELYSSDNSFRQPIRHFDLSKGVQSDGSYTPSLEEPDYSGQVERFTVDLADGSNNYLTPNATYTDSKYKDGSDKTSNGGYDLIIYIEVPPADLRNKTLGLILYGKDNDNNDVTYYGTRNGFNIQADKAYQPNFTVTRTTDYTVTLKVDHLWEYGYTQPVTRAGTGDPGYDKENVLPKYVYLFFCAGGNVKKVSDYTTSGKEGTGADDWTRNENISAYNSTTTLVTTALTNEEKNSLRVYAIASPFAITHNITTSSTEDNVKALAYIYSSQENMRDLYSTPWESDLTFIGNLKDPMQDIFVYHVAAKVDLLWNSSSKMALPSNVSVNNFQSANLSIFQPTQNGDSSFTSSTTQSISTPLTYGTYVNGRQVYYLPQFANNIYNVTIGSKTSDVTFTGTTTTGGFTSWLRGEIKQ